MSRFIVALVAASLLVPSLAQAAAPELSTTNRLKDRRYVAAGDRARVLGFEDGRFYANGWHITGEMGGIWTPPLKLVDGVWFGVDDQWVGQATRFTSGWGYTRFDFGDIAGLKVQRTDFAPDGRRGALLGLKLTNPGAARTVTVKVDAHSELMTEYPWGFTGVTPNASDNIADTGSFDNHALVFKDDGALPGAPEHHYAALVASTQDPLGGEAGAGHFGPQPGHRCTGTETPAPMPSDCDDGPFGKGTGGQLRYRVALPANGSRTLWVAVAGSDKGLDAARAELTETLRDPEGALAAKVDARQRAAHFSRLSLPGDRRLADAVDWGKQNMLDLTQVAEDLQIRWTNQGHEFPPPAGTVPRVRWIGAGFPDYPWIFATDAEYTAFANVATGQFESIEDHMRALRDVSDILNNRSGVVTHEIVSDGSIWFGHDSRRSNPDGSVSYDFNTDETVKFPSTVALIWRWTGDNGFRDEMYDFAKRNLQYVQSTLDADRDGWPEGLGNVERGGMGEEKLDNTVYYIRGLFDLADMAAAKGDDATHRWAIDLARSGQNRFEGAWWMPGATQYADSLDDPGDVQVQQKHWIGVTPMEAELTIGGRPVPGLAAADHANAALDGRETDCFSGTRPYNPGLFHTGCGGGPTGQGERTIFSLTTSIASIGEGNYGRLGAGQQRRYTGANAESMFGEPFTGGTPDEQPGAMPEILPSPDFDTGTDPELDANINRCWTCRAMFMQAWGNYGTAWAVVHQQLGVQPDLGRGSLAVIPQLPSAAPIAGRDIRLGRGTIDVAAAKHGSSWFTAVDASVAHLTIGHTLPRHAQVASVRLDGHRVTWSERLTNRGLEVTVAARPGRHLLEVRTR
jgi:hypothetical protein